MKDYMYYGIVVLEGDTPPEEYAIAHQHDVVNFERRPRISIVCAFRPFATRAGAHAVANELGVRLWDAQRSWFAVDDLMKARTRVFESVEAFRDFLEYRLSDDYVLSDADYGRVS